MRTGFRHPQELSTERASAAGHLVVETIGTSILDCNRLGPRLSATYLEELKRMLRGYLAGLGE